MKQNQPPIRSYLKGEPHEITFHVLNAPNFLDKYWMQQSQISYRGAHILQIFRHLIARLKPNVLWIMARQMQAPDHAG